MRIILSIIAVIGLWTATVSAQELPPKWEVIPESSRVTFTATQNHAPVTGSFDSFTCDIHFDSEHLDQSTVKAEIDMASVKADYEEVSDTLKEKDWFDVANFPKAVFESVSLKHIEGNQYEADGMLMIHGKGAPVILPFTLDITEEKGVKTADMKGKLSLKRTLFDVGQGEFKDTKTVEDDVLVEVVIKASQVGKHYSSQQNGHL